MNNFSSTLRASLLAALAATTPSLIHAQTLGGASGPAGDAIQVEKCEAPKGTLANVEPQQHILGDL